MKAQPCLMMFFNMSGLRDLNLGFRSRRYAVMLERVLCLSIIMAIYPGGPELAATRMSAERVFS